MNTFLRSVQVLTVERDFVQDGSRSFILYTVEYLFNSAQQGKPSPKKGNIDYREELSAEDFSLFCRLREWRKKRAAQEAVTVYTIFINEHLAQISRKRPKSKAALREIRGIGEAKVNTYGQQVLDLVASFCDEQATSSPIDSRMGQ